MEGTERERGVLYHGSRVLVPVLEPIKGAVYAADERSIALPFALVFRPDDRGRCQWALRMHPTEPRIEVTHGTLDPDGVGYLYRLATTGFEHQRYQWVSLGPVTPLDYEVIRSADYASWITRRV